MSSEVWREVERSHLEARREVLIWQNVLPVRSGDSQTSEMDLLMKPMMRKEISKASTGTNGGEAKQAVIRSDWAIDCVDEINVTY